MMTRTRGIAAGTVAILLLIATFGYANLSLRNDGIQFPDGSIQESATTGSGEPVPSIGACFFGNSDYTSFDTIFTVPPGVRLEVESMGLVAYNLAAAEKVVASIGVTFGGNPFSFILEEFVGGTAYPGASLTIQTARPINVRIYADPGTTVDCQADSTSNTGSDRQVVYTISGRLVPHG
jgi:hypothetical protein